MSKKPILDYDKTIDPMDYTAKLKYIIDILDKEMFSEVEINQSLIYEADTEEPNKPRKMKFLKNDIMPLLTPMKVHAKLNELLRIYKPLNLEEAKKLKDDVYLEALTRYMQLITYINEYIAFLPSKQTFCAFANITTNIYNELLQDVNYSQVFSSIEDYVVDANFISSQSGMVDSKATITKLQMKDAGHNLIKSPDSITVNNYNTIDKQQVNLKLEKYMGMIENRKR